MICAFCNHNSVMHLGTGDGCQEPTPGGRCECPLDRSDPAFFWACANDDCPRPNDWSAHEMGCAEGPHGEDIPTTICPALEH